MGQIASAGGSFNWAKCLHSQEVLYVLSARKLDRGKLCRSREVLAELLSCGYR